MRFAAAVLITMTSVVAFSQNQKPTEIPRRIQRTGSSRLGTRQFELIRKSLKLTEEQTAKFNALIETYKSRVMEEAMALLGNVDEMRQVSQDLKAARAARDAEKTAALEERMRELRPETRPTNEFYQGLADIADERQKKLLSRLRVMIAGKGGVIDIRLKPRQAVRLAESLGLSRAQADAIRRLQDAFREKMRAVPRNDDTTKQSLMDQLVLDIRATLTEKQSAGFDARLAQP
ncbi:MAG: hypothetical protein IID33_06765 [Planctomycetes bacterium]|nr:hypothetical protein [Planctomycetota bacterium]